MDTLAEIGLWNAAGATVLAAIVVVAAKLLRRPALVHALWVLVLLKFVAPAVIPVPVPWEIPFDAWSRPIQASPEASPAVIGPGIDLGIGDLLQPFFAACAAGIAAVLPYGYCLLSVWLAGAAIWFAVAAMRVWRFQRLLASAPSAPRDLQRQAARLAESLGLTRAPEILLSDVPMSPMLWALGPYARLVFPAELLKRLSPQARDTLLVHELAHYRRGDHWVRLLELLAAGLYWWHPLVWWGRRQLRQAEEECCDAWVVAELPRHARHYARALLDTLDYLSEVRPASLAMATRFGGAQLVRRRLVMILRGTAPKRLTPSARLAVFALALVLLPLLPRMVEPQVSPTASQTAAMPARQELPTADALAPSQAPPRMDPVGEVFEEILAQPAGERAEEPPARPARPAPEHLARRASPAATLPGETASPSMPGLEEIWATAHSPDGLRSIHASEDGAIVLIDNRSGRKRLLDSYGVTSVAFSPDGSVFATGCSDHRARLWDAASGMELAVFNGHVDRVNSVAFSPDGDTLVTGSWDHAVKFWNVRSKKERAALPRLTLPVNCVRFSPDGESLAIGLGDFGFDEPGQVQIWNLDTLSQRAVFPSESGVGTVVFTPEGKGLAAGESAGRITLWDLPSSTPWSGYYLSRENVARAAFWAEVPSFASDAAAPATEPAGTSLSPRSTSPPPWHAMCP